MTQRFLGEAGQRTEAARQKGRPVEKLCKRCQCGIPRRKTYCSPCYDLRLAENIAANRHKYQSKKEQKP